MTETKDDEKRAAEALARALEESTDGQEPEDVADPDVADLLRVADRVRASGGLVEPLATNLRDSMVDQALGRATPQRSTTLYWIGGALAASVAACALGLIFFALPQSQSSTAMTADAFAAPLEAFAAPTDALFDGPFPDDQSAAERMDRIVGARTRGYFDALIMERTSARSANAAILPTGPELEGRPNREPQQGRRVSW